MFRIICLYLGIHVSTPIFVSYYSTQPSDLIGWMSLINKPRTSCSFCLLDTKILKVTSLRSLPKILASLASMIGMCPTFCFIGLGIHKSINLGRG